MQRLRSGIFAGKGNVVVCDGADLVRERCAAGVQDLAGGEINLICAAGHVKRINTICAGSACRGHAAADAVNRCDLFPRLAVCEIPLEGLHLIVCCQKSAERVVRRKHLYGAGSMDFWVFVGSCRDCCGAGADGLDLTVIVDRHDRRRGGRPIQLIVGVIWLCGSFKRVVGTCEQGDALRGKRDGGQRLCGFLTADQLICRGVIGIVHNLKQKLLAAAQLGEIKRAVGRLAECVFRLIRQDIADRRRGIRHIPEDGSRDIAVIHGRYGQRLLRQILTDGDEFRRGVVDGQVRAQFCAVLEFIPTIAAIGICIVFRGHRQRKIHAGALRERIAGGVCAAPVNAKLEAGMLPCVCIFGVVRSSRCANFLVQIRCLRVGIDDLEAGVARVTD